MAKLQVNWTNLQDMLKDLQGISNGTFVLTDAEKFVARQAMEAFTSEYLSTVLDKHCVYNEDTAYAELEADPVILVMGSKDPEVYSVSHSVKYEADLAAIQAAGFKNQTEMFNAQSGGADSLFEGLFKQKTSVFFDSKRAERVYKTKSAGYELIKKNESKKVVVSSKKGGK